jgi:malate synthase
MFVRNVGHLMTTPAVRLADGDGGARGHPGRHRHQPDRPARPERGKGGSGTAARARSISSNPRCTGPRRRLHQPLFDAVEDLLGLARHTIKVGVMDEERRTSANLAACIHAVKDRIVFINTGFLDRTGDEMHTSMRAGAMVRKAEMKASDWIAAYEDRNVQIGLKPADCRARPRSARGCGPRRTGWPTCWSRRSATPARAPTPPGCPSPTAATLHATHYHRVDVFALRPSARPAGRGPVATC